MAPPGTDVQKKRLINYEIEATNPLIPIKYQWAWEHFLNGCANNWLPQEIPMGDDAAEWKSTSLTQAERLLLQRNFGFFSTGETLVANNLVLAIYKFVTNAECRQYLIRQAYEETIHAHAFLYICESLGLNTDEIFNMYKAIPVVREKEAFQIELTHAMLDKNFTTDSFDNSQRFLENLIGFYLILEGIFFYGGFAMVLAFQRQGKMRGVCQLYEFILRDETIHLNFGIDLINGIKEENPELWTPRFQARVVKLVQHAVDLEIGYTHDCLPEGIFGLTPTHFRDYICYIADRRLERIGLQQVYKVKNPLNWMSEVIDLNKEKNFFEQTVSEYRPASNLKWNNP